MSFNGSTSKAAHTLYTRRGNTSECQHKNRPLHLVTLLYFALLAKSRGYTSADLAKMVRDWWDDGQGSTLAGAYETPRKFADRVFSPVHADVVIPYASLHTLYESWNNPHHGQQHTKCCACGCGRSILGRRKHYATGACRTRHHRHAKIAKNYPRKSIT
jgi:hypothetical protein